MDICSTQRVRGPHNTFPEQVELQFYQAFRSLKKLGCDYFYFLGVDFSTTYRFCTHEHWIDFYHDEKFLRNDPLKRVIDDTKFIILPWEQVTHLHSNEKRTMSARVSFGLFNGLTISREHQNRKYIFALATEIKGHDLAKYFLLEKIGDVEQFISACMTVFDRYLILSNPKLIDPGKKNLVH